MSEMLTAAGYEQTKDKLRDLERAWPKLKNAPISIQAIWQAFGGLNKMMIREYLQGIRLYEARQGKGVPAQHRRGLPTTALLQEKMKWLHWKQFADA